MVGPIADIQRQRGGAIAPPLYFYERNDLMATYKDIKQKFIDHLVGVDLYKMNVTDLYTYACILKTVDEMEQPGPEETMTAAIAPLVNLCKEAKEGRGVFGIG